MSRAKKSAKWSTAEKQVLVTKGCEFISVIQLDKKDEGTLGTKRKIWELIANNVNEVSAPGTIRTWKDCNNKWTQMKCLAHGDIEELKKMVQFDDEGYKNCYRTILKLILNVFII